VNLSGGEKGVKRVPGTSHPRPTTMTRLRPTFHRTPKTGWKRKRHKGLQACGRTRSDTRNALQRGEGAERAVGHAVGDDLGGERAADPGQALDLVGAGNVEVQRLGRPGGRSTTCRRRHRRCGCGGCVARSRPVAPACPAPHVGAGSRIVMLPSKAVHRPHIALGNRGLRFRRAAASTCGNRSVALANIPHPTLGPGAPRSGPPVTSSDDRGVHRLDLAREASAVPRKARAVARAPLLPPARADAQRGNGGEEDQGAALSRSRHARTMHLPRTRRVTGSTRMSAFPCGAGWNGGR
jgi:hypothetical protein